MDLTPLGTLRLGDDAPDHDLGLEHRRDGAWHFLTLTPDPAPHPRLAHAGARAFIARVDGLCARLTLQPVGDAWHFDLALDSEFPTRLRLLLALPGALECYHVIPGVVFGDNNLGGAEPGHFPNLTTSHTDSASCAPEWEFRADRASHPLAMACFLGGVAGIAIDPYSDGRVAPPSRAVGLDAAGIAPYGDGRPLAPHGRDAFVRNGVGVRLAHAGLPDACAVTLGYGNLPRTFLNKDQWLPTTAHFVRRARAGGVVFLRRACARLDAHALVENIYARGHADPATPISRRQAATALTDAFVNINWHGANGRNAVGTSGGIAGAFFGGGGFREHFTNMRCVDEAKRHLAAWRTLPEVGWTGGGVIGYPLLVAGHKLGDATALEHARHVLDLVAGAFKPESGLLWEVAGKHEGQRLNWWWSGYLVKDCHSAYVNGSAAYYLLKSFGYAREHLKEEHPAWLATACRVLDTIASLQRPDGNFGFTYHADRPAILDAQGFAGAWFIPAMAYAYRFTGEKRYLDAAARGAAFYHRFVRDLNCWGTPLDTWKSPDQEGNLAFLRGVRLLHEITGEDHYLQMLGDSAHYEYLWRYGFRARPEYPPLKDSPWSSVGGSITSVSNPHIHPMGVFVSSDLRYLAEKTGSAYHARRCQDGLNWGVNIVSLYPKVTGYGAPGVLTERWCPSDGLTVETFPDGSPASIWFSYNGWAAAAVLEGIVENLD